MTKNQLTIYGIAAYLVLLILIIKNYFVEFPYYSPVISISYGVGVLLFAWTGLEILTVEILAIANIQINGRSILMALGIPILIPLVIIVRKFTINHYFLKKKYNKIESPFTFELYITKLRNLI